MFFLENDNIEAKKEEIINDFEDYFKSTEEYSNEREEEIVNEIINQYFGDTLSEGALKDKTKEFIGKVKDKFKKKDKNTSDNNNNSNNSDNDSDIKEKSNSNKDDEDSYDRNSEENKKARSQMNDIYENMEDEMESYDDREDKVEAEIKNSKDKSFKDKSKEKMKEIARAKGKTITKYIYKTMHFKDDQLATETMPRKVLRVAISLILTIGPWFLPCAPVVKLIVALGGVVAANAISIKKKKDLIDLYQVKLEQVNKKIEETDDEKELYEYKKIKKALESELVKVKKSLNPGQMAYDDEKK